MDNTKQFGISLCSGYGGIERGLEIAGVNHRTIAYVEIEAFAVANLVAKMESCQMVPSPVWTNLKTFPMEIFRNKVDFITAGYPCQPFSVAGARKGADDPRHLWPHIRRIYRAIHPRWMFFENVAGHITLGLSTVISDLEADGYGVKAGLFTAEEIGAPHQRKRVFILAYSNSDRKRGTPCFIHKENEKVLQWSEDPLFGKPGKVLENASLIGRRRRVKNRKEVRERKMPENQIKGPGSSQKILGDPDESRPQRRNGKKLPECGFKFPAGAGSPQFDWEESRLTKPELGGTTNGNPSGVDSITNRVDRLRLCGNGVVPQQAAKAFIVLSKLFNQESEVI